MNKDNLFQKLSIFLSVIALLVSIYLLFSPRNSFIPTKSISAVEKIKSNNLMRVGYVKFAPCAYLNPETKELEGIFIDAIREVAADMKYQVEFKETTLSTFSAALEADEFDFSIGPTFITPSRSISVDFTKPIIALGNSGLVKKENQASFSKIEDLGKPGIKIAVLQGQAMEQFVRSRFPNANLIVIAGSDLTAPLQTVESGQADIGLTNSVTVQEFAKTHQNTTPVFTNEDSLVRLALAWVVRSGDEKTKSFLDASIDWLAQSGKLDSIQEKYPIKLSKLK